MILIVVHSISGNADVVKLLIEHGADVNIMNSAKNTPLILAAYLGSCLNSDLQIRIAFRFWFCSIYNSGYADIAKILIEHGAEVNAKEGAERGPLHWAACNSIPFIIVIT